MPTPPSPSRPPLLVVACGLVLLEAVALGAAAAVGIASLGGGGDVGPVVFLVLLALGAAALLVGAVRGLWGGRRWPRGPVLTVQLFVVVAATTWWRAGGGVLALAPVVVAVVVGGALLVPSVVAVTSAGRRTD